VSLRGGDVPGFLPNNLKYYHLFTNKLTKLVWKNSISVVANSAGLKELAQKTAQTIKKEVEMIPNGVDIDIFKPAFKKNENDRVKLLFVGRLSEQKRVDYLIEALKNLVGDGLTDVCCEIIGDGPLKKELLNLTNQLNLKKYVKFLGWINRDDLLVHYQDADIFVLPSSDEGMPNVLLEAMAIGLPIIASNISGNNELVKSGVNGFLFNSKSEFNEVLKKLIKDGELMRKMSTQSLRLSENYSWFKTSEQYLEIFKVYENR
jgi:glycosyltransferase involved in cell wall biosynthesis